MPWNWKPIFFADSPAHDDASCLQVCLKNKNKCIKKLAVLQISSRQSLYTWTDSHGNSNVTPQLHYREEKGRIKRKKAADSCSGVITHTHTHTHTWLRPQHQKSSNQHSHQFTIIFDQVTTVQLMGGGGGGGKQQNVQT